MTVEVTVDLDRGAPLVTKRAMDPTGVAALQAEAERLRAAAHPGVVELVEAGPDGDAWVLRTAHAGPTLGADRHLEVGRAAALVAALAETVADLHDLGIVHGRISPSHVVVGPRGRPRLCGLGTGAGPDGTPAGPADDVAGLGRLLAQLVGPDGEAEPIPERRWGRHRRWVGVARRALLNLADQACADVPSRRPSARQLARTIVDTVPEARLGPLHGADAADLRASGPVSIGPRPDARQRLLALVSTGPAPHAPPSSPAVRAMEAGPGSPDPFSSAGHGTDLPPTTPPTTPPPTRAGAPDHLHRGARRGAPDRPRAWRDVMAQLPSGVASAAALGALVLLSAGLYHLDRAAPASTSPPSSPVTTTPSPVEQTDESPHGDVDRGTPGRSPATGLPASDRRTPSTAATEPTRDPARVLRPGCPPATGPDLDGDGCPDPVRVDGVEVVVGDRRFAAGEPGDVVVVGDWTCDGTATPAALRPSTGEVFVFPTWPAAGEEVTVGVAAVLPGATTLHLTDGPGGCPVLEAATDDGARTVVEVGS